MLDPRCHGDRGKFGDQKGFTIFTVLGAKGFIGSHLVSYLSDQGLPCFAPDRNDTSYLDKQLGHVIYCIGLTADFRERAFDTIDAHVSNLVGLLRQGHFESLLYLSSTRVYNRASAGDESEPLVVTPLDPEDIFNLSKLTGEAACLSTNNPKVRIARLSNVLGRDFLSQNFVFSILRDALKTGAIVLQTTPDSEKDYVFIDDVVKLLPKIALDGKDVIYNIGSGVNLTNATLVAEISRLTGCSISYSSNARRIRFPRIAIDKISEEFGFTPSQILNALPSLIQAFRD